MPRHSRRWSTVTTKRYGRFRTAASETGAPLKTSRRSDITLGPGVMLEGRVVAPDGSPVGDAVIRWTSGPVEITAGGVTDLGTIVLQGAPARQE